MSNAQRPTPNKENLARRGIEAGTRLRVRSATARSVTAGIRRDDSISAPVLRGKRDLPERQLITSRSG